MNDAIIKLHPKNYKEISDKDQLFDDYSMNSGLAGSYAYRTE